MTLAHYAAIRARLDHPQVVVWDPCAVTLAEDDPGWLAPGNSADLETLMGDIPPDIRLRWGLVAMQSDMQASPVDAPSVVHRWYSLVAAYLRGQPVTPTDWQQVLSDVRSVGTLRFQGAGRLVQQAFRRSPEFSLWTLAVEDANRRGLSLRVWWARCRAILPIADVTTAEIEWGDIELPPRPLADDLPGDGG